MKGELVETRPMTIMPDQQRHEVGEPQAGSGVILEATPTKFATSLDGGKTVAG